MVEIICVKPRGYTTLISTKRIKYAGMSELADDADLKIWALKLETLVWIQANSGKLLLGNAKDNPELNRNLFRKCVETIHLVPKSWIWHGKDIVQTTTQKCGYGNIVWYENPLVLKPCGFKSHYPHHDPPLGSNWQCKLNKNLG